MKNPTCQIGNLKEYENVIIECNTMYYSLKNKGSIIQIIMDDVQNKVDEIFNNNKLNFYENKVNTD